MKHPNPTAIKTDNSSKSPVLPTSNYRQDWGFWRFWVPIFKSFFLKRTLHTRLTLILLSFLSILSIKAQADNALVNNPSPYLAMHGHDPVNWQLWSNQVLQQAQKSHKLILLSSGYFACHWCHVMQKENYQNPKIAHYLNQHYVAVKIDRELSPALDAYLIDFAQRATGKAGWPQHVILTPQGTPIIAFTYQPPKQFLATLQKVQHYWQRNPQQMQQLAEDFNPPPPKPTPQPFTLTAKHFQQALLQQLHLAKDELSGGIGSRKFPNAPLLYTLLNMPHLPKEVENWLKLTLQQMTQNHLYDPVNGGFFRYTIDPEWQTPHFEKMLYTQAQMIEVLLLAEKKWHQAHYQQLALDTYHYARTHLFNPKTHLFQSSESAVDLQGHEGGAYLFDATTLKKRLPPRLYQAVYKAWQLDQPAPFDQGWLPTPQGLTVQQWQAIQPLLKTPPQQIPHDSKSILAWNALMLSALQQLATVTKNPTLQQQAQSLKQTLTKWLLTETPPRALSYDNRPMGQATLEEYAYFYRALNPYRLPQSTLAQRIATKATRTFYHPQTGWQLSASPLLPSQTGQWVMEDSATPSPSLPLQCAPTHQQDLAQAQRILLEMPINTPTAWLTLRCQATNALTRHP